MTEIRFYHLHTQTPEQALPAILAKALEKGCRIIVRTADEKQAEAINNALWTFHPNSFLPHGSAKDGRAEKQPIWITDKEENPNKADTLIITDGKDTNDLSGFSLCCEILDSGNEEAIKAARARWKRYNDKGLTVTYWKQNTSGSWDKK